MSIGLTTPATARNLWQQLDLLTRIGVGIAPVAADLAGLLRRLVGADAAALFWLDDLGMLAGFFHEDSPPEVQEIFLHEYERLFVGQGEINVFELAQRRGRAVGHLLEPGADYFRSNTYNLLVRPSGHHHTLDLRIDVDGRARAVVLLFRAAGRPFAADQAAVLSRAFPYLQRAIEKSHSPDDWQSRTHRGGHILLDAAGTRILMLDQEAAAILRDAPLRGQGLLRSSPPELPRDLLRRLAAQSGRPLRMPIPGGALVASARPLQSTGGDPAAVLVDLTVERPRRLDVVQRILALRLSPLQREIALLAGLGHPRSDCVRVVGVSPEALKKHLRAVFAATGARDWESLARVLGG
jgi:DNA-binding CsgD family transcriptional regulator